MGALSCRLNFRKHFLHAVSLEPDVTKSAFIEAWAACSRLLPEVLESNKYGISVPESISPKIQRRLASTVPPRPIVVGDFKESYEYLRSLFEDGKATGVIFDCQCAHEIMVGNEFGINPVLPLTSLDLCFNIWLSKTTAICVYQVPTFINDTK